MSETNERPRVRVPAGSEPLGSNKSFYTRDGFVNLQAGLGYGANNQSSASQYAFNPITRNHYQLDMAYRGSWIVRQVVDAPADDMCRAGILVDSDMEPDDIDTLDVEIKKRQIWQSLNATAKWARLYGGCIAMIQLKDQNPSLPLRLDTIKQGDFQGLLVLDRWMVWASTEDTIDEPGPNRGRPKYYTVVADARGITAMKIHHSRVIRLDGVELPFFQSMTENGWGLSVVEPLFDRLIAFDSVTLGAAQLAYKAHLRVMSVDKLRELIASGGRAYQAFLEQMQLIRMMQSNEGLTVIDASDKFESNQYAFSGLSDLISQFGQQLSGASRIPLTRLFGQSPAGMNATGESDMRNYYDSINAEQESRLRVPFTLLLDVINRSVFGKPLPKGFSFTFKPLWQMTEVERASVGSQITGAVDQAVAGGLVGRATALKELRQQSRTTGMWSNITDEDIDKAEQEDNAPPPEPDTTMPGQQPPGAGASPPPGATPPKAPADTSDGVQVRKGKNGRKRKVLKALYPNVLGLKRSDIHLNGKQHVLTNDVAQATLPMRDFNGLALVIETPKGMRRIGHGWSVQMPADYGYISGTGSHEGGSEQFDCFLGTDAASKTVWIVEQHNAETDKFDEYKAFLAFPDKQTVVSTYLAAFSDGLGRARLGRILEMDVKTFKAFLRKWPYSTSPARNSMHP